MIDGGKISFIWSWAYFRPVIEQERRRLCEVCGIGVRAAGGRLTSCLSWLEADGPLFALTPLRFNDSPAIYLSPGFRLSYDKWSSYVSVGIPIVNEQYGIQPDPSWRIIAGMSLAF